MNEIYTFAKAWGNKILYRGYKDGIAVVSKDDFKPKFYLKSKNTKSPWKSLSGDPLEETTYGDIRDAKEVLNTYKDVAGFDIHGNIEFHYQYLANRFPSDVITNTSLMKIWFIDIETVNIQNQGAAFPDIQSANHPIVLISVHDKTTDKTVVFGYKSITTRNTNYEYRLFKDEKSMLIAFITYWQQNCPDIVSGWNISQFDIPYIVNRIMRELDEDWAKKLSPFNIISERELEIRGKKVQTYDIVGVVELDYLDLFKKYMYSQRESYALGAIAQEELGETKLENPGKNFRDFWENHYDTFVDYNAKDSILVHKLDDKLKLIDLVVSVAYLAKCNIRDCLGVVKVWDVFIYNFLLQQKVAIPPQRRKISGEFEGAYVKDVIPGMYGWTVSFDFASLYPTIIRQWNMSPETIVDFQEAIGVKDIVSAKSMLSQYAVDNNLTIAANGSMYRKDKEGVLPQLMAFLMDGRKIAKKQMLTLEKQYQDVKTELAKRGVKL